jgi:(p)ppGpp synthase/HD superfamily hydrolase
MYSRTLVDALAFAAHTHERQARKQGPTQVTCAHCADIDGPTVPYLSHLMGVAAIVMEAGGGEIEAIAGILHDAVEDQDVKLETIADKFGADVARIVDACSENWDHDKPKPAWRPRKEAHLTSLASAAADELLVTAADKIHNGESIINDANTHGAGVWCRFNASREDVLWYYCSVLTVVKENLPNEYIVTRLTRVVEDLEALPFPEQRHPTRV